MFAWLDKFLHDVDTFKSTTRVVWVLIKTTLLALSVGFGSGQIPWPEGMPGWVVIALAAASAIIQFTEKK